jgi:hypothetical protein
MSDDERVTRLVRVGPSSRDPTLVAVVLVGVIAVMLVKPWGEPVAPATAVATPEGRAAAVLPPRPVPTPAREISGVERLCYEPSSWWLAAIVRWPGQTVQTRELLPAARAQSPLDPAIPFEAIHSSRVQAIGYCAPVAGTERPPNDATVAVWRLDQRGAVQIQPPTVPEMGGSILGRLWSPPPGPVATLPPADPRNTADATWPTGRYVITIQAGGAYSRWLGVEVLLDGRG